MENINFNDVVSFENLRKSAKECSKGVRWKPSVQMFDINALQWTSGLHKQLMAGTYKSMGFYKFWLMERGKLRYIQSVHISERCVQKTINNYGVKPIVEPRLIYDNGASRVGKGTEFAIKRLRKHLATHFRKHGTKGAVLTIDFHDYFNSIPHDKLYEIYDHLIRDPELLRQTKYFIDCFGDTGLGLGSELSQISAILYPNELDHFIKEKLHIKGYARYMDDSYLIHEDINYLRYCRDEIEQKLKSMSLEFNPKTKITRLDTGSFIFLKRRFKLSPSGKVVTRLLRTNITKRRRILKKQKRLLDAGQADLTSIKQSYQSWRGYASKWDSRATVRNMDLLFKELFNDEPRPKHSDHHKTKRNNRDPCKSVQGIDSAARSAH